MRFGEDNKFSNATCLVCLCVCIKVLGDLVTFAIRLYCTCIELQSCIIQNVTQIVMFST